MSLFKAILLLILFAGTYLLTLSIRPELNTIDQMEIPNFETTIPNKLPNWQNITPKYIDIKDISENSLVNKVYNQTLDKVFTNANNQIVVLTLGYGLNQTDEHRVHKPDTCYPAQGYNIESNDEITLSIMSKEVPARFLKGVSKQDTEYVTYWIVIGGVATANDWEFKKQQLKFALEKKVPDGLLFRLSSNNVTAEEALKIHTQFANQLAIALNPRARQFFFGKTL